MDSALSKFTITVSLSYSDHGDNLSKDVLKVPVEAASYEYAQAYGEALISIMSAPEDGVLFSHAEEESS